MPSDYERITCDNIDEYGKGKRHLAYFGDLHPDKTHFIFEVLQNAEDADASQVRFIVSPRKLEVMHDGQPFNTEDVKGVCGIGETQKADDLTKIGRFGIGFKSVYAYTDSPEIHSGDEHFVIKDYIRPHHAKHRSIDDPWTTRFVFPFDKDEPDQKTAFRMISDYLSNLDIRTLLFLRKIEKIEYKSHEMNGICLRRESSGARKVVLIRQKDNEKERETWIVFKRPVQEPDCKHEVSVDLGYYMTRTGTIGRVNNTRLVVYFQTEKPTGLDFYISGPYRTTPARDNVPDDDRWNRKLIEETAELTVKSLHQLKTMGLLTVSLLETLPIKTDDFPPGSMFHPIFTRVREALKKEALLPTDGGSFVAAQNAMLARGTDLMKLLDGRQLADLFASDDEVQWLSSDIAGDLRKYMIGELKLREVTPESVANKISQDFLEEQSDEWVNEFYCFLSGHKALWKAESPSTHAWETNKPEGILRSKAILRLQDGTHVCPFNSHGEPNAYLSLPDVEETQIEEQGSLQIIRVELTRRDEALKFLKDLGIRKFDIVDDVIKHVLPKYERESGIPGYDEHQLDLERIRRACDADSGGNRLKSPLSKTPFIFCTVAATGRQEYRTADKVYFRSDDLCSYFEGSTSFAYIDPPEDQRALYERLGVEWSVRIRRTSRTQGGYIIYRSYWGDHCRGRDGFDRCISVDGLKEALDRPTIEKSAFIWREIAVPNYSCIRGKVESSTRQNYLGSEIVDETSKFGSLLISKKWLPDRHGNMHRPCDLFVNNLHESFGRDDPEVAQLSEKLGMMTHIEHEVLEKAGVSQQDLEDMDLGRRIRNEPPETRQQIEAILAQDRRPEFPTEEEVKNPERRQNRVREEYKAAPQKAYEQEASNRYTRNLIDPDPQLKAWYTNESEKMVCQICEKEMPFRKRDGEYYFESVEIFTRDYLPREHASQYLALCPLCAAKYQYFVKQDKDKKSMEKLRRALIATDSLDPDGPEVPLEFGRESATVRFVSRHVIDLRAILNLISESSTP